MRSIVVKKNRSVSAEGLSRFWGIRTLGQMTLFISFCLGIAATAHAEKPSSEDLRLREVSLQDLHLERGEELRFSIELGGHLLDVELFPYSLRSSDFQLYSKGADGRVEPVDPGSPRTYRGSITGEIAGMIAASVDDDGVRGMFIMEDDSRWFVQPVSDRGGDLHALFRADDLLPHDGSCAADFAREIERRAREWDHQAVPGNCVETELGVEGDYAFYLQNGSSVAAASADIGAIVNGVDLIFARDVNINFVISGGYIITSEALDYPSTESGALLAEFRDWWNANAGSITRDTAHLFTGKNMDGSTIGRAYTSVICNQSSAYGVSEVRGTNMAARVGLVAHEIGHNYSAAHCNGEEDCWIMCSGLGGCDGDVTKFAVVPILDISAFRDSRTCLSPGGGTSTPMPPTARDDVAVAVINTAATIDVLENDFDPNCGSLTIGSFTSVSSQGGVVAQVGDALRYTPPSNFLGLDAFDYTARDASGDEAFATVKVSVETYRHSDDRAVTASGVIARYYDYPVRDLSTMPNYASMNPYDVEVVADIDFSWTSSEFGGSGREDYVGALVTGSLEIPEGENYSFYLTSDDGSKLFVDGSLVVDNDGPHGSETVSGNIWLSDGSHDVRVEYYEGTVNAVLRLEIAGGPLSRQVVPSYMWTDPGVRVAYYDLTSILLPTYRAMVPYAVEIEADVNFVRTTGNFAGSGRSQDVGAVFEGLLSVPSDGIYTFHLESDDGSAMYIGKTKLIDNDKTHGMRTRTGSIALSAGPHVCRIEYFERGGSAGLDLRVESNALSEQQVPASWWSHVPTYHVPVDYPTIAAGVAAATARSEVWVAPGVYTGTGNKNLDLDRKDIILRSEGGPLNTIIDCEGNGRGFNFNNHTEIYAVIDGFTVRNASNSNGGVGGAMAFANSSLYIRNCILTGNTNPGSGGAVGFVNGSPIFEDCILSGNYSGASGGAIAAFTDSSPSFVRCTVSGNRAGSFGGGAYVASGSLVFFDQSIVWGNDAALDGDEGWTAEPNSTLEFTCSAVRDTGLGGSGTEILWGESITVDPEFCHPAAYTQAPSNHGWYSLATGSPCLAENNTCNRLMGAMGEGCLFGSSVFPEISLNRSFIELSVEQTHTTTEDFVITNLARGVGILDWGIQEMVPGAAANGEWPPEPVETPVLVPGPKENPETDSSRASGTEAVKQMVLRSASGGPDAFGYTWMDSREAGGPVYEWTDIRSTGFPLNLEDDDYAYVNLLFSFPFYGQSYGNVRISSNGYLTFGTEGDVYQNQGIPNAAAPNALIAPFWDDLNPTDGGTIHYEYDTVEDRFTVQYTDVPRYGTGGNETLTFQVILESSGAIVFQYADLNATLSSATVGIEDHTGVIGTEVVYNDTFLEEGLAVRLTDAVEWIWVTPAGGSMAPLSATTVTLHVDAREVPVATYEFELVIWSNDPDDSPLVLPVTIEVQQVSGVGDVELPAELALERPTPNPMTSGTSIQLALPEAGSVSVHVYDAVGRKVASLVEETLPAGLHVATWDGRNEAGVRAAAGVYFLRMETPGFAKSRRVVVVR